MTTLKNELAYLFTDSVSLYGARLGEKLDQLTADVTVDIPDLVYCFRKYFEEVQSMRPAEDHEHDRDHCQDCEMVHEAGQKRAHEACVRAVEDAL